MDYQKLGKGIAWFRGVQEGRVRLREDEQSRVMPKITEDEIEQQALEYLSGVGYEVIQGNIIAPEGASQ